MRKDPDDTVEQMSHTDPTALLLPIVQAKLSGIGCILLASYHSLTGVALPFLII